MNIQLYLNNVEIDLNEDISIPLNRTFENLSNPTNVIVDYSKSINIPITQHNTEVFGQIFRLDRVIIDGQEIVGTGFNPTKKIPMRLVYNNDILLEGYAKFLSTTYTSTTKHYTISLFGVLGDIFQKLLQVVLNENDLAENLTSDYILDDHLDGSFINKDLVKECWDNETPKLKLSQATNSDIIGFAPAYRGFYSEFDSSKVQTGATEIISIDEYISAKYKDKYLTLYPGATEEEAQSYIDSLDVSGLVGDGFKDYEMNQYRSYQLKPYIYFNKLVQMYQEVLPKISDYSLELDVDWFNSNNPYWSKLCYMLDYLEEKGTSDVVNNETTILQSVGNFINNQSIQSTVINGAKNGRIYISPTTINIQQLAQSTYSTNSTRILNFNDTSYVKCRYEVLDSNDRVKITKDIYFSENKNFIPNLPENATVYPINQITNLSGYNTNGIGMDYNWNYIANQLRLPVPQIELDGNIQDGDVLSLVISIVDTTAMYNVQYPYTLYNSGTSGATPIKLSNVGSIPRATIWASDKVFIQTVQIQDTPLKMKSLYKQDKPLFNVILQYTKMFGLLWDVDYVNRKIKIVTRDNYFKDYTIEDWNDKIDISNEYTIEPVSFQTQSVVFNYEETEGYRYSGYQDKYNSVYGDKKLYSEYEFNTEETKLFEGVEPSCSSSRSYRSFGSIYNWNLSGVIQSETDEYICIEDSDEDDSNSIGINGWYFRKPNIEKRTYITDDSSYQSENSRCYYGYEQFDTADVIETTSFPQFSVVDGNFGCIFNKPMEDYTYDQQITSCDSYIYNYQWDKYINERYNIQNKKITTYFNLSPIDYLNFKFNKFVTIQNQLFMVNKIFDYQLNGTSSLTKCELIQISDTEAYTNSSFTIKPILLNKDFISVNMPALGLTGPNGTFEIIVDTQTKPTVTIGTPNVGGLILGMTRDGYNQYRYVFSYRNMGYTDETMISEITFTNEFGSVTVPVAVVGAGTAQITPNTYSVYSDSLDSYKSISFDSTLRPYTMLLSQTGGNMYYGTVELVDIRNDSDTTIDGELEWTHVQDEIFIGEIFTRNAYVTQRIPVIIDTQDTQINCSDDFVYVQNVKEGTYILEFTSIEEDYTIELIEDKPTPVGSVSIISDEQWEGARYIELLWSNFDVPCTWKGKLLVTNSKSTRIIPIILKITR